MAETENIKGRPMSFEVSVAKMSKWLLGAFSHFAFRGFKMQGKRNPLSFEVLVAEMPKWLIIS